MSKIYISQIPGGHEVDVAVSYEPPERDWSLEQVEEAESTGACHDDGGSSLVYVEIPAWTLIVTWEEPESGVVAFGPYGSDRDAEADWGRVGEQFMNEGQLPEDVEYRVVEMSGDRS